MVDMRTNPRLRHLLGAALAILVLTGVLAVSAGAQEIRIRVLDGRNGSPVPKEEVQIWLDRKSVSPIVLRLDRDATARIRVNPDVTPALRVQSTSYIDCRPLRDITVDRTSPSWLPYSLANVLKSGLVLPNKCGKVTAKAEPGELVLFVRPWHWWERMWE